MTKSVRVENADSGNSFKLVAYVENRGPTGEWLRQPTAYPMDFPTALVQLTIHGGSRVVVEEVAGS